jgi:hypothetical protein
MTHSIDEPHEGDRLAVESTRRPVRQRAMPLAISREEQSKAEATSPLGRARRHERNQGMSALLAAHSETVAVGTDRLAGVNWLLGEGGLVEARDATPP